MTKTKQTKLETLKNEAATILANQFLSRATLAEALSQIPLNAVIKLCQNKALEQGKQQAEEMKEKELKEFIKDFEESQKQAEDAANSAVQEVSNETAEAS